jgi:hypothetical protein
MLRQAVRRRLGRIASSQSDGGARVELQEDRGTHVRLGPQRRGSTTVSQAAARVATHVPTTCGGRSPRRTRAGRCRHRRGAALRLVQAFLPCAARGPAWPPSRASTIVGVTKTTSSVSFFRTRCERNSAPIHRQVAEKRHLVDVVTDLAAAADRRARWSRRRAG